MKRFNLEFTIRFAHTSGADTEWDKFFRRDLTMLPHFMLYGWRHKYKHIDTWLVLSVPFLQKIYADGRLEQAASEHDNIDRNPSKFKAVSIPRLRTLCPELFGDLFVAWSPGHPAFAAGEVGAALPKPAPAKQLGLWG